jgi:hypothetical protein
MPDNEEYLLRLVKNGLVSYLDLKNGLIDLGDVRMLNNYLDVLSTNEQLATEK